MKYPPRDERAVPHDTNGHWGWLAQRLNKRAQTRATVAEVERAAILAVIDANTTRLTAPQISELLAIDRHRVDGHLAALREAWVLHSELLPAPSGVERRMDQSRRTVWFRPPTEL